VSLARLRFRRGDSDVMVVAHFCSPWNLGEILRCRVKFIQQMTWCERKASGAKAHLILCHGGTTKVVP
jgi:hypothetical protein